MDDILLFGSDGPSITTDLDSFIKFDDDNFLSEPKCFNTSFSSFNFEPENESVRIFYIFIIFILDENDDENDNNTLPFAIIKYMKQYECYVSLEEIVNALKKKEKTFRKANGAKYTGDFTNSIKATLRTSGLFIKNKEGKYFYKEKKAEDYISKAITAKKKKKNEIPSIDTSFSTSSNSLHLPIKEKTSKQRDRIPTHVKIKLNKVNETIERIKKKYQSDNKKYESVLVCCDLFTNLINKYLFFIKMKKINSINDLGVLNEKIMGIISTIEKIERNEIKIPELNNFFPKQEKFSSVNEVNITHYEGNNNLFSEPPTTCSN